MRLLVHACCGPCSVYTVSALSAEGFSLQLYFYNPNIHPFTEYERREEAIKEFATKTETPLIIDDEYDLENWFRQVLSSEGERCRWCYYLRLRRAAETAKAGGFSAFTTTLLYSIYQKHELIREVANLVATEMGVPFLYRDFRLGFRQGVEGAKALGLYRQKYCGCLFSERERYQRRKKSATPPLTTPFVLDPAPKVGAEAPSLNRHREKGP